MRYVAVSAVTDRHTHTDELTTVTLAVHAPRVNRRTIKQKPDVARINELLKVDISMAIPTRFCFSDKLCQHLTQVVGLKNLLIRSVKNLIKKHYQKPRAL